MKLFGEYLVENGLVTKEVVIAALIKQAKSVPSLLEIVFEEKLLKADEILLILSLQVKESLEFKAAAEKLGFWNQDLNDLVFRKIRERRVPIGHILLSEGCLDLPNLTKAFDDFISIHAKELTVKKDVPRAVDPKPIEIEKEIVAGYVELFDESKRSLIFDLMDKADNENLELLCRELHTIRGAARFVKAERSENLAMVAESLFKYCKNKSVPGDETSKRAFSIGKEIFQVLWELRNLLFSSSSEGDSNHILTKKVAAFLDQAKEFLAGEGALSKTGS